MLLQTINDHFNPFSYQPKNKLREKKIPMLGNCAHYTKSAANKI